MWYIMNWKTFTAWQLGAIASGCLLGWVSAKWQEAYSEAKAAGVVADR